MGLPLYLAGTHWELPEASDGEYTAFMACHFSSYGDGLDIFEDPPRCGMVILNDRVPVWNHNPGRVTGQLREVLEHTGATAVLLDLQRSGCPDELLTALASLPCPVGVTPLYGTMDGFSVFLEVPMHRPLSRAMDDWKGRELWLDAAGNTQRITVTREGSRFSCLPRSVPEGICHRDEKLHCSYHIEILPDRAEFTLFRTREDLQDLLQEAERLGFTRAVGLYQELHDL